jgi:hypothetical protein
MRFPAPVERFLKAKRSVVALSVFVLGLCAFPLVFAAGGIYFRFAHYSATWRPSLDYFEWITAAFGFLCCIVSPFLAVVPMRYKVGLSFLAVCAYVVDLFVSAFVNLVVFRVP